MSIVEKSIPKGSLPIHPRLNNITNRDVLAIAEISFMFMGAIKASTCTERLKKLISEDIYKKTAPFDIRISNLHEAIVLYSKKYLFINKDSDFETFLNSFQKLHKEYLDQVTLTGNGMECVKQIRGRALYNDKVDALGSASISRDR